MKQGQDNKYILGEGVSLHADHSFCLIILLLLRCHFLFSGITSLVVLLKAFAHSMKDINYFRCLNGKKDGKDAPGERCFSGTRGLAC